MKKVSEMPWDDADFVAAMKAAWESGYRDGESDGACYYSSYKSGNSFDHFMRDAKAGYED